MATPSPAKQVILNNGKSKDNKPIAQADPAVGGPTQQSGSPQIAQNQQDPVTATPIKT